MVSCTFSYLWCILVVYGSHTYIGYGALTDPQLSSNLSKDRHIQSSDAGYFNLDPLDETSVENWSSKPAEKRDDSIVRVSRGTKRHDCQAICRKKSKGGVEWSCKTIASCQFGEKLLSANQQTVCGGKGSSQKICCPDRIDPVKVAEEKCQEYAPKSKFSRWRRVSNGQMAVTGQFPHMGYIGSGEVPLTSSAVYEGVCSGSLISPQYILTAAHCNDREVQPLTPTWVVLGQTNNPKYDTGTSINRENVYRIVKRINHPEYRRSLEIQTQQGSKWIPPENDIALFKLDRPIIFSSAIRPVCLALPPNVDYDASRTIVAGWGQTGTGQPASETLLWAKTFVLANSYCVKAYEDEKKSSTGFDAKSMICAGPVAHFGGDTCEGDSGGPLQFRIDSPEFKRMWFQKGITSFGSRFCDEPVGDMPAIYTRVSNFLPWIQTIVWPAEDLIRFT